MKLGVCLTLLGALVAGCKGPGVTGRGCSEDGDCGSPASAFRCEAQTGACYCRNNDACPASQFCNVVGFCQDRSGCEKNADCLDASLFCETTSGTCLARGRCSNDLQCGLGQVCDTRRSICVEGCRHDGDCPGTSCRCGEAACGCDAGTPEGVAACALGVCDPNFCSNVSFCRFGELCQAPPDAGGPAACFSDYSVDRRPYCDNCTFGGGTSVCGRGPNFCLVDTRNPGNSFCGADCSQNQTCPRGYACQEVVVVVSQWACSRSNPSCPMNSALPCTDDSQCRRGGVCAKQPGETSGFCSGRCAVDEGDEQGFCNCQVDSDCPQETCTMGECSISRRPCITDNECRSIACVDFQGSGGCRIGSNCAPANGLSCGDVR